MATYVSFRDGGKTNEEGFLRPFAQLLSSLGVMGSSDLAVSQRGAGANKSVDIAAGDAFFSYNGYAYYGWNTATVNDSSTVITDNSSGNPRIDAVVAYIDLTVVSSASSNNPNALKFKVVAGTPAGSPSAPDDSTIQSSIGAGNPFIRLANVAVANGFSSIVNANITDTRTLSGFGANSIADAAITNRKLKLDEIQTVDIGSFSTSSTSYVDVTGLAITFTPEVPSNALVFVQLSWYNSSTSAVYAILQLDGVTQGTDPLLRLDSPLANKAFDSATMIWCTGLTAASHTFKVQMKAGANLAAIYQAKMIVIPFAS